MEPLEAQPLPQPTPTEEPDTVRSELRAFIIERFLFGEADGLGDDTLLLDSGLLDSMAVLELISFIEQRWRLTVADDELVPEHFSTLPSLADYVIDKARAGRE